MPKIDLFCIDADQKALAIAKNKSIKSNIEIRFDKSYIQKLPYNSNYFDIVYSSLVFHHLDAKTKQDAMKEIFRVLKPGGQAILQVPFSLNSDYTFEDWSVTKPEEREKVFGQFDHLRIYGRDYMDRLRSVGFTVSMINISAKYKKAGLNEIEDLFVILKPEI